MTGDDTNDGDHAHDHGDGYGEHDSAPNDPKVRARALQSLLVEKGVVTTDAVDAVVSAYEDDIGPLNGARVVARAWTDEAFRERLLESPSGTIADEFDFAMGIQHMQVVENTDDVHNVVVCTLCSCYPWAVLGLPPTWYKSPEYRSRVVREPRTVLEEFGLELDDDTDVRVWDSSSEVRYMVLPQRPPGTEGMTEAELAGIVDRDSMIGVGTVTVES